jgi:hypothetical protein
VSAASPIGTASRPATANAAAGQRQVGSPDGEQAGGAEPVGVAVPGPGQPQRRVQHPEAEQAEQQEAAQPGAYRVGPPVHRDSPDLVERVLDCYGDPEAAVERHQDPDRQPHPEPRKGWAVLPS